MKFEIKHEIKGRMRVHIATSQMSFKEADILQYYLSEHSFVTSVKIYERNCDATICYTGSREQIIHILKKFSYANVSVPEHVWQNSGREVNREYWDKLVESVIFRSIRKRKV